MPGTGMYYTTTSSWAHRAKEESSPPSSPPNGSHPGRRVPSSAAARASETSDSKSRSQRSGAALFCVLGVIAIVLVWLGLIGLHNHEASMERFLDAPYVAKDKESLKAMISARYVNDNAAENRLIGEKRVFTVAADTKIRIIEIQNDKYVHLRIISGPHTGQDGWVSRGWVKYEPTT